MIIWKTKKFLLKSNVKYILRIWKYKVLCNTKYADMVQDYKVIILKCKNEIKELTNKLYYSKFLNALLDIKYEILE